MRQRKEPDTTKTGQTAPGNNRTAAALLLTALLLPLALQAQQPWTTGPTPADSQTAKKQECHINYGAKGGFTASLFLASDLLVNGVEVDQIQNNYKIGYFGSLFMRINFGRHFLQPEASYTVNRCDITFLKPTTDEADAAASQREVSSIRSSIHSIEMPVIYGYNLIKEGPYSLAIFAGPKLRYILGRKSRVSFDNFDQQDIHETLYPLNISLTTGVAVTISPVFFDFRYDLGLHNISKQMSYRPAPADPDNPGDTPVPAASQIRFHRRDNVLSFSLGMFF